MSGGYQPYYAAFLRKSNERGMVAFIIWINEQWQRFAVERPSPAPLLARHKEFEEWLMNPR